MVMHRIQLIVQLLSTSRNRIHMNIRPVAENWSKFGKMYIFKYLDLKKWRQFSCVCPVIDHEFRHNIVKVGDSWVDPQTILTMVWRNSLSTTMNDALKTDVNCFYNNKLSN